MDEQEMVAALQSVLDQAYGAEVSLGDLGFGADVEATSNFNDSGLMTDNAGLVVRLDDGSEFQVSVVQSRGAA